MIFKAHFVTAAASLAIASGSSFAQSLFVRTPDIVLDERGRVDPLAQLSNLSYFIVEPPEPREIQKHDLVYVIVDETTRASSSQTLETTKDLTVQGTLNGVLDPRSLLEARLVPSGLTNFDILDADGQRDFSGEGDYQRQDQIVARLAAKVLDVKPNGTILLEATKTLDTDGEQRTFVLSGICRQEDITNANTILTSQLADLRLTIRNEGEVRNAAKKGLLTKVAEALFNF